MARQSIARRPAGGIAASRKGALRRATLCACAVSLGAACSPDPTIKYEAYAGTAYPNRAAPIAWPKTRAAVVANSYSDSVVAVDLSTGMPILTRPMGRNPVDLDGPHHVAVDPATRTAFIALSYPRVAATGPHAAHGSSSIPGYVQKISLDDFSILGNVRVDDNPGDIVFTPDHAKLLVSHFDLEKATKNPTNIDMARASLAIVDPTAIEMIGSAKPKFVTVCVAPHGIAVEAPPGTRAFLACYGEDAIGIVDVANPDGPVERIPVAPGVSGFGAPSYGPYAVVFSHDGKTLAVSDTESHDVRLFDPATKTFDTTKTLSTLGAPEFTSWSDDDATLYVPVQQPDMIYAYTLATGDTKSFTFDKATCQNPHIVAQLEGKLYLVCEGDHTNPGTFVVLDDDLNVVSSAPLGRYPDSLALLPEGFQ